MERTLPYTRSCYVCGVDNPRGFHLRMTYDGRIVRTRFAPSPDYAGFFGVVHGGVTASLLDEVMTWAACVARRRFCFTASFSVRYLRPWRFDVECEIRGWTESARRRRIATRGEVVDPDGEVLASAEGIYLPAPDERTGEFATDFVEDPRTLPVPEIVPESFPDGYLR